ncbi:hypothetical protein [Streptomyces tropicalis]|uniref:ABC transporter permease n=1 Tax=Streptomyces tropicalis TaxID=3034234 RepID=A0ABT6A2Z3_9ACTN|nr:hypothetical protein [Streptomyces tropicalis]MDF3299021.1 hypothetical protein [Streptomyces tropicalis]
MTAAPSGPSVDGSVYTDVGGPARRAPAWFGDAVTARSAVGLGLFAVLMPVGRWRARRVSPEAAVTAPAVPVVVVAAYGGLTAIAAMRLPVIRPEALARWLAATPLRPLLAP